MNATGRFIDRKFVGLELPAGCEIPNLVGIQTESYESFLQNERIQAGLVPLSGQGLQDVFESVFPITSQNNEMTLSFSSYKLDYDNIKFSEIECKKKGRTYAVPLRATIALELATTGEIREKEIYLGDLPLMTDRGTFIVNGSERVIISQVYKSPGVTFTKADTKKYDITGKKEYEYTAQINPHRGSWLEFVIDEKKEVIWAKIDRNKKILGSLLLRAIGFDTRAKIVELFYAPKTVLINDETKDAIAGSMRAYSDVFVSDRKILRSADVIQIGHLNALLESGVNEISVIDTDEENQNTLHSEIILNCFDIEDAKYAYSSGEKKNTTDEILPEPTQLRVYEEIFRLLKPNESISMERAEQEFIEMFFNARRYDLSKVGRYNLLKKFASENEEIDTDKLVINPEDYVLKPMDIVNTMRYLVQVYKGEKNTDEREHLGNKRVRGVGELLQQQLKVAFAKMERIAKERMNQEPEGTVKPQDLIANKPIVAKIREFFGSSQFSQFMDQVNPLAELTHKRRITSLGPGGVGDKNHTPAEVRDTHYSHYGRMCPVETPEGPNIGLILSLANYTKVNSFGFLETPYRKVINGKVTDDVVYLDANDEEKDKCYIAQTSAKLKADGSFADKNVPCRLRGDFKIVSPKEVKYMEVSPRQVISVAASLIPFLEHDDANRALMGSNMQRQAVPILFPEAPRVGTGMEGKAAYDSGILIKARRAGVVSYVSSTQIRIRPNEAEIEGDEDVYAVQKFQRTNQDTCFTQKPIVTLGETVGQGDVIADGPATDRGELALGRNLLVGFVPWNGYNYEDAVLISERVVKEDIYTSIHIKELSTDIRETKLGSEVMTRDIPSTSEKKVENLDINGIVNIGTVVRPGDILVGKITPKTESDTTPELRLLNSIFGEKAKEVRDTSLKVPHGTEGVVIDVQILDRESGDDLPPGVEKTVKVLIAAKRKLRQGDKMAGRHGNKGVVSRILPEEDMPFMADGTTLDVCLNPLGVPSRMNIGQLMETQLGWAAVKNDEWYTSPVFQSATYEQIEEKMIQAGLPENSKTILYDGRTGQPFVNPVFCGYIYYLKLNHLVDDKMHARSTGPYSLVTQQPLGGKAQFGGQRLGEMEIWALDAHGAANTLQEFLTVKSDDPDGRTSIYQNIVKGNPTSSFRLPKTFQVLEQEFRGVGIDISLYDSDQKQIPLTERDEQNINKKDNQTSRS